jgi:hypothetical protein
VSLTARINFALRINRFLPPSPRPVTRTARMGPVLDFPCSRYGTYLTGTHEILLTFGSSTSFSRIRSD